MLTRGLVSAITLMLAVATAAAPVAGQETLELPLSGPAYALADEANQAFKQHDYAVAIAKAREALRQRPDVVSLKRLLVMSLAAAGRLAEAEASASAAIAAGERDDSLVAMRGRIRRQLASRAPPAPAAPSPAFRAADAAYRAYAHRRYGAAVAAARTAVRLAPRNRDYRRLLRNAVAAHQAATARQAVVVSPATPPARPAADPALRVAAEIGALADLGRTDAARARFAAARAAGDLASLSPLDLAYLANRVGDARTALDLFEQAQGAGTLQGASLLDAAYTAQRLGRNAQAVALFEGALDAQRAGTLPLEPQRRFEVRRTVADLTRRWGAYASLSYGAVGVMPNSTLLPAAAPSAGEVLQAGLELYWRAPVIGYRNGRTVDLFGRVFETLADQRGRGTAGAVGAPTRQGAVGIRWKPFSQNNLVLEFGRLIKIGAAARNDWLLRAAFSDGRGTDLRFDRPHWWLWNLYGEVVRYPQTPETVLNFEARLGRSVRLGERLVVSSFLALGGGYDTVLATPGALGTGPGLNLRYWFRADHYRAPRSFVDIGVQYRFKLAGDNRAAGIFAGLTLAY